MCVLFCFQAEDGIRDLVRSRGLGDVYKRQHGGHARIERGEMHRPLVSGPTGERRRQGRPQGWPCLLYTSDAADERSSVDLGGRRIIKKKKSIRDSTGTSVELDEKQSYMASPEQADAQNEKG